MSDLVHHWGPRMQRVAWMASPASWRRRATRSMAARRRRAVADRDLQTLDACTLRDIGLSHHAAARSLRTLKARP